MAADQAISIKEFEGAIRRLGWLSAYSRQILMTRHLLRNLGAISEPDDVPQYMPGDFFLHVFRCSITILTGVNRETKQFSSPYEPLDRPETHYLAYSRQKRIFSASIASGMPDIHFHIGTVGGVGFENSTEISVEDRLLSFEILSVAKNISLTKKPVADGRAEALRMDKLWRGFSSEDQVASFKVFENWHELAGKNGAFWRDWYQGLLVGKPLDWELQRRVALIDNRIWDAGLEAVAEEIEKIRIKFDLEKRIGELEAELRQSSVNRHGIGGNLPPEQLENNRVAQELLIVFQPLKDLKNEVLKDDPDPSRLRRFIAGLVSALKTGLAWSLKKGDLIVDTSIKWVIPAGGTGYLALNPEKLEVVIELARKLVSAL